MKARRFLSNVSVLVWLPFSLPAAEPLAGAADLPLDAFAAVGSQFAESARLGDQGWSQAQIEAFIDGVRAAFRGQPYPASPQSTALQAAIGRRVKELNSREMGAYFADPKRLADYMQQQAKVYRLQLSDSGLAYGLTAQGSAARPGPDDTVVFSYKAVAADGQTPLPMLTAERRRVRVAELLPGLAEGVQMMAVDSKAVFILPPELSFGAGEWPAGIERGIPIIFTATLHEVIVAP